MFDEVAEEFMSIAMRSKKAADAVKESDPENLVEEVEGRLPLMRVGKEKVPMFDTPEEAKEASEDEKLIELKSFGENLIKYVYEGL